MKRLSELPIGLPFGIGPPLSGMTDPGKVIGFLDLSGAWYPSLALVMGGAVLDGSARSRWPRRRRTAWLWPSDAAAVVHHHRPRRSACSWCSASGWGAAAPPRAGRWSLARG